MSLFPTQSVLEKDLVRYLDLSGTLPSAVSLLQSVPSREGVSHQDISPNNSYSSFNSNYGQSGRVITFRPSVCVMELVNINPELGRIVMEQPNKLCSLLQKVMFMLARYLDVEDICQQSQVVVIPSISGLIPFYNHEVLHGSWLASLPTSSRLRSLPRAVVVGLSETVQYVSRATYRCTSQECLWGTEDSQYVKIFSPMDGERKDSRLQECLSCGEVLKEEYSKRDVRDSMTGELLVGGHYTVSAVFRQKDGVRLQLGAQFNVVFSLVHERAGHERRPLLEVWGLEPLKAAAERQVVISGGSVHIPDSIQDIYRRCIPSPWSFVLHLACLLGNSEVTLPSTHINLKLGLLLSLVSSGCERVHVLATGEDLVMVHRLIRTVLLLSPHSVLHCIGSSLTGCVTKDCTGAHCVRAGLIHQARDGVLYLGDITQHKPTTRRLLLKTVENNTVISPPLPHSTPLEQPLTCAFWALAEGSHSTLSQTVKSFNDVFGLVIHTHIMEQEVMDCINTQCGDTHVVPYVPPSELGTFLNHVRHRHVSLSPNCLLLLKRYFLASRRARQDSQFPQAALHTLLHLAKCHTKLSLRCEGLEEDAVFACYLYESNLTVQSGYSLVGLSMEYLNTRCKDSILGPENDRELRQFQTKLHQFVVQYGEEDKEYGSEIDWEE